MVLYAGWATLASVATNSLPAEQAVTYTYVAGLLVTVGYLAISGDPVAFSNPGVGVALAAGSFLGLGTLSYYIALADGSAAIATSISGMYLLLTTVVGVLVLGESLSWVNVLGICFAVCAVVLLSQ